MCLDSSGVIHDRYNNTLTACVNVLCKTRRTGSISKVVSTRLELEDCWHVIIRVIQLIRLKLVSHRRLSCTPCIAKAARLQVCREWQSDNRMYMSKGCRVRGACDLFYTRHATNGPMSSVGAWKEATIYMAMPRQRATNAILTENANILTCGRRRG